MKKMISNVLVLSLLTTSFGTLAATKNIAEILEANKLLKLSNEEVARKTANDIIENKITQDELMEYFESELPATAVQAIKNSQNSISTPEMIQSLMMEMGKGAEYSSSWEDLFCLNDYGYRSGAMLGGAVIALLLFSEAHCNTSRYACVAKAYDNPSAGSNWNSAKNNWESSRSPSDPSYNDFSWYYPEPSYSYVATGSNNPAKAAELRKYGAVVLGVTAAIGLSCVIKPRL